MVSALGDRFTQMSLLTIALVLSQDSGEKMAWITFFSLLPFLLFGQIFGVLSDRFSRKKIMISADILRAGLVVLIPFVIKYTQSFTYIYLLVFCIGILSALFSPAKMAIVPNIVDKEVLLPANSLIISTGMISTLAGTLIGGFLIKLAGTTASFFVNCFTFVFSAFMILQIVSGRPSAKQSVSFKGIFKSIKEGLSFINRHQLIFRIVQLNAVFSLISGFFYITILNYSTSILKLSSVGYGILLSCLGLGLCSGALLLGKKIGRLNYNRILLLGFSLVSLMNILFIFKPNFVFSLAILIVGGIGASLVMITLDSLLQRTTPDSLRANVFGARGIVTNALFLVSLIVTGKLLNKVSFVYIFGFMGFISLSTAVLIYLNQGSLGYKMIRGVIRLILRLFYDLRVKGLENLPPSEKVILAGNHTSLMDGLVVMAAYPHRVYFMAAESVFKRKDVGIFARQLGFIPVKRGGLNKEAIKEAVRILETRNTLGIFPEGKITDTEELEEGKKGTALIALKTNTPVVPFVIEGAYYAWPRGKKYPRRHPIEVRFSNPIRVKEYTVPQELTDEIMGQIRRMKTDAEKEGLLEVDQNIIVKHLINFE